MAPSPQEGREGGDDGRRDVFRFRSLMFTQSARPWRGAACWQYYTRLLLDTRRAVRAPGSYGAVWIDLVYKGIALEPERVNLDLSVLETNDWLIDLCLVNVTGVRTCTATTSNKWNAAATTDQL